MTDSHSDALVFYGVTGDLAFKKIFPALQAMVKRGQLNVPVVGVARSHWTVDQLRQRVRESLEKHGGVDPAAFDKLAGLLRYVSVDYTDPGACRAIYGQLKDAKRPPSTSRCRRTFLARSSISCSDHNAVLWRQRP